MVTNMKFEDDHDDEGEKRLTEVSFPGKSKVK